MRVLVAMLMGVIILQSYWLNHFAHDSWKWKQMCKKVMTDYACVKLEVERMLGDTRYDHIRLNKGDDDGS